MDKKEFELKINEAGALIKSTLIYYLINKFADNPISDKVFKSLLVSGGVGQLVDSNVLATAEKLLTQLEEKVLMAGSGIGRDGNGQRIVAGFTDSVNEPEANLATPARVLTKDEEFLKARYSSLIEK